MYDLIIFWDCFLHTDTFASVRGFFSAGTMYMVGLLKVHKCACLYKFQKAADHQNGWTNVFFR